MKNTFELFFLNNGVARLQTNDYAHIYDDMRQCAHDVALLLADADPAAEWEGNEAVEQGYEPIEYDSAEVKNGHYIYCTEADMAREELYCGSSWSNARDFCDALRAEYSLQDFTLNRCD